VIKLKDKRLIKIYGGKNIFNLHYNSVKKCWICADKKRG